MFKFLGSLLVVFVGYEILVRFCKRNSAAKTSKTQREYYTGNIVDADYEIVD